GTVPQKQSIYSRAGVPQGYFFVLRTQGTCSRRKQNNPEGSLPLEGKVSAEQTDEVFLQKPVIYKIFFAVFFGHHAEKSFNYNL
ncbi:MAG: hypothetical protein IJP05_04455, partial [Oscillospiraceae bacterium]|nr:hypothetical protein [Oscillospiraceae bacterium]